MLKALDLLKLQYDHHLNIFKDNKELGNPFEDKYILYLKEAIAELEALETKECYSCKSWSQEFQSIGICDKGIKEEKNHRETMTYHNFCCNKWEVKNECS